MTVTPVRLHYEHTASPGESAYLRGLADHRLLGQRCGVCGRVYVPPRGTCPADGVPTREEVELPETGTVTTFCVVNVAYPGQRVTPPYVAAAVLLDGADIAFQHLILGCEPGEVRMGLRVRAVWGDAGTISHFAPARRARRAVRELREVSVTSPAAVVGFAQTPCRVRPDVTTSGVEMLVPIFAEVFRATGLTKADIGFWCSGSSDYLAGRAFSFVQAVDAIGAVPPTMESHVEMDAAWALYEAWVKVLTGEAEIALAYGFGKSSGAQLRRVLALQLDPYLLAPLWPDSVSIAALQARLGLDAGLWTEKDMAAVAARSRGAALGNPAAQVSEEVAVSELLARPYVAEPLRAHDCAPVGDGAAAVIIASQARARELCARPAWITGFAHRIDSGSLGARDLLAVPSASGALSACAAAAAGRAAEVSAVDVAELHAPFTHQEILLRQALRLGDEVEVNPSGGALCGNPMFAAGLARIGMAAQAVMAGRAGRALGHATSGPALQQNLVCVMEATQ